MIGAARHFGYTIYFMTHRANQVPPVIRTNCSNLCAFYQSPANAKIINEDWFVQGDPALECPYLPKYHFLQINGLEARFCRIVKKDLTFRKDENIL